MTTEARVVVTEGVPALVVVHEVSVTVVDDFNDRA